jgi:hypothetical protein
MLGIDIAQSTVAKYIEGPRRPPSSQGWKTFLRKHAASIASYRPVCRADHLIQTPVWLGDPPSWSPKTGHG